MQRGRHLPLAAVPLILISLLAAPAFSQSPIPLQVHCLLNPSVATDIGTCIGESTALAAMGLAVSFAIVALTYMIGEVLELGNLKGWYRRELWETTKSLLLVGVIYSSLVFGGTVAESLAGAGQASGSALLGTGSPLTCPSISPGVSYQSSSTLSTNLANLYNVALVSYLQPAVCSAEQSYAGILGLSLGTEAAKTLGLGLWVPFPIFPPDIFASLQFGVAPTTLLFASSYFESITTAPTYSFLYDVIKFLVTPVLFILQYQLDLLPNIVMMGLGVFIPFGVVLRAIPFLRGIGGTMVAIGIGLSLVYPAMLVILNLPITDFFTGLAYGTTAAPTSSCGGNLICLVLAGVATPSTFIPLQISLGGATASTAIIAQAADTGANIGFWDYTINLATIYPALNLANQYVLAVLVQLFLFVFDLILGITFIQAIARSLGGQLRLSLGRRIRIA